MVDAMIVVGAPNSSNSQRLKEVAERAGCPHAVLVQRAADIDWGEFGAIGGSASPPAPRRRKCWSRRSSAPSRSATRSASKPSPPPRRGCSFRCPARCGRARRRSDAFMAVYTDVTADDLTEFLSRYEIGDAARLQGHRRGRGEFQFPGAHQRRQFHSHAVREARGRGRPAVLPRADGASRGARHHLSAAGEEQSKAACSAKSPAGRRRSSPFSTACGSAARMPAIARRSARRWPACISPARISRCKRANALSIESWRGALRARQGARRQRAARPVRGDRQGARRAREILAARSARRRDPRRSVSRQRVLPRRQAVRADRFLFRLHRHARL